MPRLLLLWFACVTLLPFLPAASAQASRSHSAHATCCPAPSDHDGVCADNGCLGCSIGVAVATAPVAPPVAARLAPIAVRSIRRADHRPAFDPPPPRSLG